MNDESLSSTHNDTSVDDVELSMTHKVAFISLWAVGLVLNAGCAPIVGCVLWKRRTWPIILLFMLTLTDAIVVVFGISVSVASIANKSVLWDLNPLCYYQSIVINTWYLYSYVLVLAISLDRYLAVCHPFVYNKQLTERGFIMKGVIILSSASVLMLLISCLPLLIDADIVPVKPGLFCFFDWTSHTTQNRIITIINVGITSLTVGLLLFFTIATCCGIYKMVQSSSMRDGNVSLTQKATTQSDNEMEVKFAKLMIVVVILFAACNLPFVLVIVVQMSSEHHSSDIGYIALAFLLFGTQLNPIVHAMVQRSVRKSCLNVIKKIFHGEMCQSCCSS